MGHEYSIKLLASGVLMCVLRCSLRATLLPDFIRLYETRTRVRVCLMACARWAINSVQAWGLSAGLLTGPGSTHLFELSHEAVVHGNAFSAQASGRAQLPQGQPQLSQ